MKRHCFIVFFLLMFFLLPSAEAFSLQTVDGDVREVLRSAARMGGINLVLDDTVRGKVTIELQEVAPEEAIRLIALARGFSLTRSGSTLVVSTQTAVDRGFSSIHIFPIHFADMNTILSAVKLSLHEGGFARKRRI